MFYYINVTLAEEGGKYLVAVTHHKRLLKSVCGLTSSKVKTLLTFWWNRTHYNRNKSRKTLLRPSKNNLPADP